MQAREQPLNRLGVLAQELQPALAPKEGRVRVANLPAHARQHERMTCIHVDDQAFCGQQAHGHNGLLAACAFFDAKDVAAGQAARKHPVAQAHAHLAARRAHLAVQLLERLVPVDVHVVHRGAGRHGGGPFVIGQVAQDLLA